MWDTVEISTTIPLSQEGYYSNGRNFDNDTSLPGGIQISNSLNKTEILLFRRSHNTRIPSNLVRLQSNSPPLDHKLVVFIYTNLCPKGRALVGVDKSTRLIMPWQVRKTENSSFGLVFYFPHVSRHSRGGELHIVPVTHGRLLASWISSSSKVDYTPQ